MHTNANQKSEASDVRKSLSVPLVLVGENKVITTMVIRPLDDHI